MYKTKTIKGNNIDLTKKIGVSCVVGGIGAGLTTYAIDVLIKAITQSNRPVIFISPENTKHSLHLRIAARISGVSLKNAFMNSFNTEKDKSLFLNTLKEINDNNFLEILEYGGNDIRNVGELISELKNIYISKTGEKPLVIIDSFGLITQPNQGNGVSPNQSELIRLFQIINNDKGVEFLLMTHIKPPYSPDFDDKIPENFVGMGAFDNIMKIQIQTA